MKFLKNNWLIIAIIIVILIIAVIVFINEKNKTKDTLKAKDAKKKLATVFPLKVGSKNEYVLKFQKQYNFKIIPPLAFITEDGDFGSQTEGAAVMAIGTKTISESQYNTYLA